MTDPRVQWTVKDHIAHVWLNRADKLNGLDLAMFKDMVAAAKAIRRDKRVRVVILAGRGQGFSAGLDFKAVQRSPMMALKLFLKWPWRQQNLAQKIAHCWRDLPVPVIAALHGSCFGGGLQIALACDFRIAAADTQMSVMEMKWGLIPDMSAMVTLSRLTRLDIAQWLTMTGRRFDATEALEYGLVTQVAADPLAAAEALAQDIARQSPDAVAAAKYLFKKTWKKDTGSALRWERWVQARLLGRRNQRLAMKQGLGKDQGPAPFQDRSLF